MRRNRAPLKKETERNSKVLYEPASFLVSDGGATASLVVLVAQTF